MAHRAGPGGGAGDATGGPTRFEPGAPIGVVLARGDVSMVGTGTVTHVEGDAVAGFGHPFFGAGELYVPIASAEIHMVIPSVFRSFKLSSPLGALGTLVQDRQAAIVGVTGRRAEMMPVRLEVKSGSEPPAVFEAEIVRHHLLTPMLASIVALSGVRQAAGDMADVLVTVRGTLAVRGHGPLVLETRSFSRSGIAAGDIASARPIAAISALLGNPFEPARIVRLDLEVSADFRSDFGQIEEVRLPADEVDAGTRVPARVVVRTYGGATETVTIPFDVPRAAIGDTLKVVVASGGLVEPDRAPPESFADLLAYLAKAFPNDALVLSVYRPDEGVTLRGAVIPDLPGSALDVLRPGASSRRGRPYKSAARIVVPYRRMVFGKAGST